MVDENTRPPEAQTPAGAESDTGDLKRKAAAKGVPNILGQFGKTKPEAKGRTVDQVRVSDGALASIIGLSAHEVPGVVGMAPASMSEGLRRLLGARQVDEGVVIEHPKGEKHADVDLHVVVAYGVNIPVVADSVRERVKYAALHYAGITLDVVRVRVVGVSRG
ncbi:MAG TPA: Asp23/Gls24 family envelope stress response protein [Trueperaceae bacterium]|nr:Asp23/Gls24 family envelope stress response protein [Trueperaceae bacterium]